MSAQFSITFTVFGIHLDFEFHPTDWRWNSDRDWPAYCDLWFGPFWIVAFDTEDRSLFELDLHAFATNARGLVSVSVHPFEWHKPFGPVCFDAGPWQKSAVSE